MQEAEKLLVYFVLYSFMGWLCEVIYCSVLSRKLVNRGFLAGPVCPVYGFGALFIIWLLESVAFSLPFIFMCGMVVTSIVEYITGWLLEAFFGTRWWDYSDKKFNLDGRVCLENSICFGMMSVLLLRVIHPIMEYVVWSIPSFYLMIICILFTVILIADSIITLNTLVNLNERLRKLYEFTEELRKNTDIQEWFNEREENRLELNKKLREKFEALTAKRGSGHRLIRAFPGMRSNKYNVQLSQLKEALKELKQKVSR